MDFGQILSQFENMQKKNGVKNTIVDKDSGFEKEEEKRKSHSSVYIKNLPIDATLDLHGLTQDEAWNSMQIFTENCIRKGYKKVLFIHGKGNHSQDPVLGNLVRLFIEQNPKLGKSAHPDAKLGGSGATWVLIKR
ncbi:MAG: Smr/MutS family protein [Treponema sp.]|uniref:Smr/MutS family protein n=1 Tax=Treponema sp. TaxID=166 RepID=UPI00298E98DC|nr:Smr/MutS family protein [Treponema sp.]MCR5386313.1 Smr/MutS family protein [Treponema sp.]